MRITQSMISRTGLEQLSAQRNRMAQTQEMAATGLRINRPSDDPIGYRNGLFLKDALGQTERFMRSVVLARPRFAAVEGALADSAELVNEAVSVALAAENSTNLSSDSARDALQVRVEQMFEQLLAYSNSRGPGGEYVFSGTASDTESFTQVGDFASGTPPTVTFDGQDGALEVEIEEDVYVEVSRGGATVFQGTVDVFQALGRLWTGLETRNDAEIQVAHGELQDAFDHLVLQRSLVGGEEAKANRTEDRLLQKEEQTVSQISQLEDADVFEVYSDLVAQESALQASLQVTSRLLQPTLLDFI